MYFSTWFLLLWLGYIIALPVQGGIGSMKGHILYKLVDLGG